MTHLVFLHPAPLARLLSGHKTVESRLSKVLHMPCRFVQSGDVLYFKAIGGDVRAYAAVRAIDHYIMLWPDRIRQLAEHYADAMGILPGHPYWQDKRDSTYGWFFWLANVQPCHIPKARLPEGVRSAWVCPWEVPV